MNQPEASVPHELVESTLRPLWACWRALYADRGKRAPLDLDLPDRRAMLDAKGRILSVPPRARLAPGTLLADYLHPANVAAAKALEMEQEPSPEEHTTELQSLM